jgi:hypothetical protein
MGRRNPRPVHWADPRVLRRNLLDDRPLRRPHRRCVWVVANVIPWPGDVVPRREMQRRERRRGDTLEIWENRLREENPADFETTPDAEETAIADVLMVENAL